MDSRAHCMASIFFTNSAIFGARPAIALSNSSNSNTPSFCTWEAQPSARLLLCCPPARPRSPFSRRFNRVAERASAR